MATFQQIRRAQVQEGGMVVAQLGTGGGIAVDQSPLAWIENRAGAVYEIEQLAVEAHLVDERGGTTIRRARREGADRLQRLLATTPT